MKIDRRRNYYLTIDTETANGLDDPMMYDLGGAIHDRQDNDYMVRGRVRATAEILYRYIKHNNDFIEDHTGLEDVLIEKEIFAKCMAQHKKMRKEAFAK